MHRPGVIERAFELARSGDCASIEEIRSQLKRESHASVDSHLGSPMLGRQLRKLCTEHRVNAQPQQANDL
jgi:hypothetical protein